MRLSRLVGAGAFALLAPGTTARTAPAPGTPAHRGDTKAEPAVEAKKFIIEVEKGANLEALVSQVSKAGARVVKTFKTDVFIGLSIESEESNVDSLQELSSIAKAWPVGKIHLAPAVPSAVFSDDATASNYSVHAYTGVEQLHAQGIFGKGVVVAVVDTGVDYNHPALGGGYGPGFKVAGGYDLVGDADWPVTPKAPDDNPIDFQGHGTHVSGIIAGKTEWYTGVAPEATLLAYKVFSAMSGTDEDTLIDAFLRAYEAGADIITSSIGGTSGWSEGAWATVASRLVDQGVLITISAGNSGDDGPFYASSGSSGENVIAVASTDPSVAAAPPFTATFTLDGVSNTTTLAYFLDANWPLWDLPTELPIIPVSLDPASPADACSPFPAGTDLSVGIVLIRRGTCTFAVKQANAAQAGAQRILFYNNENPPVNPGGVDPSVPVGLIDAKAGAAIIGTIKAGGNVTAKFTVPEDSSWAVGLYNSGGGIPSEFTSWGATFELEIKPDVAAPGRNIYSSYLDNQWAVLSGTSMACPYVAGVAALYIGKYGGRSFHGPGFARELANRIITSGATLPWQVEQPTGLPVDFGFWAPVPQVGTGLINATKVLSYTTLVTLDKKFALNDTGHFERYHHVDITNQGPVPVTYNFTLQPAGTFNAQSPQYSDFLAAFYELQPYAFSPQVKLPSQSFTVNPGETKRAEINFEPPVGLDADSLPVYSGKVLISGSNGEELSVPYLGVGFDLQRSLMRRVFASQTPYQVSGPNREDISIYNAYDFNLAWDAQGFPKVYAAFKWGPKMLRWDIFEPGWHESSWNTYPPVAGENGFIGSATYWLESDYYWNFDPATMNKETTIPFPLTLLTRTSTWNWYDQAFWWFGKLANGTYIAPGNYTMRFAALVPFGIPDRSDNWHVWDTPQITILPYEP